MDERIELRIANRLDELERVAHEVERLGTRLALPRQVIVDVQIAVDEVLTNVISYAYADTADHLILLRMTATDAALVIEITDDGRPFDPSLVTPPDVATPLPERSIGGLGLHLVRKVMDDLAYRRQHDRNILTMTKRIDTH